MMIRLPIDYRSGMRALMRSPGFTLLGVCTLAIGIGASSAIFSAINGVLLRPFPVEQPDRLVRITSDMSGMGIDDAGMSPPELFDLRERTDLFTNVSGLYPIDANLTGGDQPERIEVLLVDTDYFDMLGVGARVGRTFTADDYRPGIAEAVVISEGLWRRRFGGDASVVGRQVRLDEDLFTIVGVMPAEFWHPGRTLQGSVDMWVPSGWVAAPFGEPSRSQGRFFQGILARLRPGVSIEAAAAAIDAYGVRTVARFGSEYPPNVGWKPRLVAVRDDLTGDVRPSLLLLFGAVGLVLLLACSSVANLQLTRAMARGPEFAVRAALGASRARLISQLLVESLAFSLAGGVLGVLLAQWGTAFLSSFAAIRSAAHVAISVDGNVLAFTFAVSVASGLLAGIVPALRSSRPDVRATLQSAVKAQGWSRGQGRFRSAMVVLQYALAMVLLVSAALLVRSFAKLYDVKTGFEPRGLLSANVWLPQPNDRSTGPYFTIESRHRFYRGVLASLAETTGVESAAITTNLPLAGNQPHTSFTLEAGTPDDESPRTAYTTVSPGYFETMGIALVRGRGLSPDPGADGQALLEVLVNARFVEKFMRGLDPIGQPFRFGGPQSQGPWMTIVGVADDALTGPPDAPVEPQVYRSLFGTGPASLSVVVRTSGELEQLASAVQAAVQRVDPNMPLFATRSLDSIVAEATARRRVAMMLFGIFALIALAIATVGVYGVMSYSVVQRVPEIGLRIALGADRGSVLRLVLREGMVIMGIGVTIGLVGALAVARLMRVLLFGVTPGDPASVLAVTAILVAAGVGACWLPGRRAANLDPGIALHQR